MSDVFLVAGFMLTWIVLFGLFFVRPWRRAPETAATGATPTPHQSTGAELCAAGVHDWQIIGNRQYRKSQAHPLVETTHFECIRDGCGATKDVQWTHQ